MTQLKSLENFDATVAQAKLESAAPGLTFAVLHGGKIISSAAGVLSVDTGIEARPDSLFQIGSITKSLTSTLCMQAAEECLLDIDAPVVQYIGARVGKGPYSEQFTARQLMCHLSGLDGDLFVDSGRDNDALAKYMIICRQLEFMAPPGRYYNYSNAGYAVLGRVLEVVRGDIYDRILDKYLFGRLGLNRSTTIPEIAAFRRTASGHSLGPDGTMRVAPLTLLPRAMGPAGLSLYSTAPDLAAYANAHLEGSGLLSRKSAEAMRTPHAELPENATWGLGWKIINGEKVTFVGHDGGTIGHVASLWTSPAHGLAVAMCANGGLAKRAWDDVAYPIFQEVCGEIPELRPPPEAPAPRALSLYEGDYDNLGVTMYVRTKDDRLVVRAKIKSYAASDVHLELHSVGDDKFRTTIGGDDKVIMQFLDSDKSGRPQLFYAGRLHKRKAGLI